MSNFSTGNKQDNLFEDTEFKSSLSNLLSVLIKLNHSARNFLPTQELIITAFPQFLLALDVVFEPNEQTKIVIDLFKAIGDDNLRMTQRKLLLVYENIDRQFVTEYILKHVIGLYIANGKLECEICIDIGEKIVKEQRMYGGYEYDTLFI